MHAVAAPDESVPHFMEQHRYEYDADPKNQTAYIVRAAEERNDEEKQPVNLDGNAGQRET